MEFINPIWIVLVAFLFGGIFLAILYLVKKQEKKDDIAFEKKRAERIEREERENAKGVKNGKMYDTEKATLIFKKNGTRYYMTDNKSCFAFNPQKKQLLVFTLEDFKDDYANFDLEGYTAMFGAPEEA